MSRHVHTRLYTKSLRAGIREDRNEAAAIFIGMTPPDVVGDLRQRYEATLVHAMAVAERHLPRDQALEVAHDVTNEMLRIPPERMTAALIYVAVTYRLRRVARAARRRSAVESAYHERWLTGMPAWAEPDTQLEIDELQQRIAAVVAGMPAGMREVFLLIREEELSYRDAAARLGVGVGTVHTQLSRASALLRACVAEYQAGTPSARRPSRGR